MSYTIEGKIIRIEDAQSFASGFTKREFVIETDEKYPQQIKFECLKDGCDMLDGRRENDWITVHFNLRGREYNGRYFVNLHCWKIEGEKAAGDTETGSVETIAEDKIAIDLDEEDVPF